MARTVTTLWDLCLAIEDLLDEADAGGDLSVHDPIDLLFQVVGWHDDLFEGNGCATLAASGWEGAGRVPNEDAHLVAVGLADVRGPNGAYIGWRFGAAEEADELEECAEMGQGRDFHVPTGLLRQLQVLTNEPDWKELWSAYWDEDPNAMRHVERILRAAGF